MAFLDIVPCLECRNETFALFEAPVGGTRPSFVENAGIPELVARQHEADLHVPRLLFVRTMANGNAAPVTRLAAESLIVSGPVAWQPR